MALPGVSMDEITTVYSHVHALGQCREIIRQNGWKGVVAGDTAGAARMIADSGGPDGCCPFSTACRRSV